MGSDWRPKCAPKSQLARARRKLSEAAKKTEPLPNPEDMDLMDVDPMDTDSVDGIDLTGVDLREGDPDPMDVDMEEGYPDPMDIDLDLKDTITLVDHVDPIDQCEGRTMDNLLDEVIAGEDRTMDDLLEEIIAGEELNTPPPPVKHRRPRRRNQKSSSRSNCSSQAQYCQPAISNQHPPGSSSISRIPKEALASAQAAHKRVPAWAR